MRVSQCNQCHARAERERRSVHRQRFNDHDLSSFFRRLRAKRADRRVLALIAEMMKRYGGPDGLAAAMKGYCDRATPSRAASALTSMMYLMFIAEPLRQDFQSEMTSEMTAEELAESIDAHTAQIIQTCPELAIAAAQQLGWTVTPPDEPSQ